MRQSEPWHNNKKPWSLLECKDTLGSSKPPMLKKGGEGMCRTCSVCGKTEKDTRIIKKGDTYYCRKHYLQLYRHGKILTRTIYDENTCVIQNGIAYIKMFSVKGKEVGTIKVDAEDLDKVKPYKWHAKKSNHTMYATTHIGNKKIFMHCLLMGKRDKKVIDHINGDGLDNRKSNLSFVSHGSNIRNQTPHKKSVGVRKTPSGRFRAVIMSNHKSIHLGTYDTYEEAQRVRNEAEKELRA